MSTGYRAVQWTPGKRRYDVVAVGLVAAFVTVFIAVSSVLHTGEHAIAAPVLAIRATGACAIVLLHITLCIGPATRLDRRFLTLLANRRHLGVLTFLVGLVHAALVLGYYHGFGNHNPLVSVLHNSFTAPSDLVTVKRFPFELLGATALAILFLMAATSHDFWLKNLSAGVWKRLHMLVYVAYALLIAHVGLGALQSPRAWPAAAALCAGAAVVSSLQIVTGIREVRRDRGPATPPPESWIDAGAAVDIPEARARTVCAPGGERIAIFKHNGAISAVTNVCRHQGGPLGEGKIIDGCITCPWHGWQYRPGDGCSPPPFTEKVATYQVRIVSGRVQVNPRALAPGTPVEPARLEETRP